MKLRVMREVEYIVIVGNFALIKVLLSMILRILCFIDLTLNTDLCFTLDLTFSISLDLTRKEVFLFIQGEISFFVF